MGEPTALERFMLATVEHDGVADRVAVEEPLEIRIRGEALAVTMRTPGHDEELACGFLWREGLLGGPPRSVGPPADLANNVVEVDAQLRADPGRRRFYTTSSCGVCGKGALDEVAVHAPALASGPEVARALLAAPPPRRGSRAARAPPAPGRSPAPGQPRARARRGRPPQRDGQGRGPLPA